jgi:hypothetical protein
MISCVVLPGLRGLSVRQEVPSPVHLLEKESEKESDGVLQLLYGRKVLPRTSELHRYPCHVYTREYV